MYDIKRKETIILQHEENFASTLASNVIDKPRLSVWMIFIPIFFVFYFYQLNKYSSGCKIFTEHYLADKKKALREAAEVVTTGKTPDINELVRLNDVPEEVQKIQKELLAVLIEHYSTLLKADGDNYASLVHSAYSDLTNYVLLLNRLNKIEKEVHKRLNLHLSKSHEGVTDVLARIESHSERLRRETAKKIFQ